jgi:3'-phosphoadenosine 5'-phosphosulfate sulfotransferase
MMVMPNPEAATVVLLGRREKSPAFRRNEHPKSHNRIARAKTKIYAMRC